MSDKPFPTDWEQPITARGVTRNPAQRCYNVRISVAGKQLHVACRPDQASAAYFFDLALWKLRPKMAKPPTPNSAENFSFITQFRIDDLCPRLNKLYDQLPELTKSEAAAQGEMADYDKAVEFLRRAVVDIADIECKLANRMGKLARLHKLSSAPLHKNKLVAHLVSVRIELDYLRDSLDGQRAYYQKLIDNS